MHWIVNLPAFSTHKLSQVLRSGWNQNSWKCFQLIHSSAFHTLCLNQVTSLPVCSRLHTTLAVTRLYRLTFNLHTASFSQMTTKTIFWLNQSKTLMVELPVWSLIILKWAFHRYHRYSYHANDRSSSIHQTITVLTLHVFFTFSTLIKPFLHCCAETWLVAAWSKCFMRYTVWLSNVCSLII